MTLDEATKLVKRAGYKVAKAGASKHAMIKVEGMAAMSQPQFILWAQGIKNADVYS
jgi:hypothetical protein